jgi:hypothetical protein
VEAGEMALLGGGVVLAGLGLWAVASGRGGGRRAGVWGRLSEPTRLVAGLSLLGLGYHLVVWAFPVGRTPVQLPREHWEWVVVGLVGLVGASVLLDRVDGGLGAGDGDDGV